MIRRILISLALLSVLTVACGAPPEPAAETQSALNGYSVPPAGGWGTEPWLCTGTWNPMTTPWPMNGVDSYCQWQPSPTAGIYPQRVSTCAWNPAPAWPGTAYIYSGDNYTGSCAMIYGSDVFPAAYQYDADLVEVNGWHSRWTPPGGTMLRVAIKSIQVGPSTNMLLCEGPLTGPSGAPCNKYRFIGLGTQAQGVNYPHMTYPDGSFFETAAIQIAATSP